MHDIRVPASIPTVSRSASDKGISRPSIAEMSDITWQVSGAPLCLSSVSIACAALVSGEGNGNGRSRELRNKVILENDNGANA
jgi:hypothetical protein